MKAGLERGASSSRVHLKSQEPPKILFQTNGRKFLRHLCLSCFNSFNSLSSFVLKSKVWFMIHTLCVVGARFPDFFHRLYPGKKANFTILK